MKALNYVNRDYPDMGGWQERHLAAIHHPIGHEWPIVKMLHGWLEYATQYRIQFDSEIGNDGVLGREWEAIGKALLGLLNGNCGRLDCGTLDSIIRDNLTEQGFNADC